MRLATVASVLLVVGLGAVAGGCVAVPVGPPIAVAPAPVVVAPPVVVVPRPAYPVYGYGRRW
jgi:hypothetical protein